MQRCAASRQVSASSNPALIDQEQARTSGPLGPSCSLRSRGRRRQLPPTPCQFQNQAGGPPLSVHCVVSGSHVSVADDPDSPHRYRRLQEAPQQLQPQLQPESYNYCPQRPQVVHQNSFPEVTHSNPGHEAPPETGTFSKFRQRSHDALAQLRQRSWQQQHQEDGQERQEGNSLSSLRQKSREKLLQLRQQSLEKLSSTSQSSSSQDGSPKSQDLSFSFSKFRQQSQDKLQNLWHQDRGSLRLLPRVPSATPEQGGAGGGKITNDGGGGWDWMGWVNARDEGMRKVHLLQRGTIALLWKCGNINCNNVNAYCAVLARCLLKCYFCKHAVRIQTRISRAML